MEENGIFRGANYPDPPVPILLTISIVIARERVFENCMY
jgi:hypothetical protein